MEASRALRATKANSRPPLHAVENAEEATAKQRASLKAVEQAMLGNLILPTAMQQRSGTYRLLMEEPQVAIEAIMASRARMAAEANTSRPQ